MLDKNDYPESYTPTMQLRLNDGVLEQMWQGNLGDEQWRAVPEKDPWEDFPDYDSGMELENEHFIALKKIFKGRRSLVHTILIEGKEFNIGNYPKHLYLKHDVGYSFKVTAVTR